jgi:hypothetical protein
MVSRDEIGEEFGPYIHIVPCVEESDGFSFGVHEFILECACHPTLRPQDHDKTLVIHTDRVN